MPYKDKEKNRIYQRDWQRKNREKIREYNRNLRRRVLQLLGNQCVYCGCNVPEAMEINHIKGGGEQEHKGFGYSKKAFYLAILNGSRPIDDLELTCAVCNAWHRLVKLKNIPDRWTIWYHKDLSELE